MNIAFLHGDLEKEIFMDQPEGYEKRGIENLVCRLKKFLYGLKQMARMWYKKFDTLMKSQSFSRGEVDHCVYYKMFDEGLYFLAAFVCPT